MIKYCFANGKIIPVTKATLPIYDIGIIRGYAIFDYGRIFHGVPFLLKEHLARLRRSAKKMGLQVPLSDKEITAVIQKLLTKNKMKDACVRILLTGGEVKNGLSFDPKQGNFFILIEEAHPFSKEYYTKGAKLITHEHERMFSDVKTINYITAVSLQKKKVKAKATEILYHYNGNILECTTSNLFLVKNGKIITSKDTILIGTTRNFVISLAKKIGISVEEREVTIAEIEEADEAFITSTNRDVMPIIAIDEKRIGNGAVGPIAKKLIEAYNEVIKNL